MSWRDNRGSLHIFGNIALSLKDKEGFAALADFHSIINLISIDKKVDLCKRVCKTWKCGGTFFSEGRRRENLPKRT